MAAQGAWSTPGPGSSCPAFPRPGRVVAPLPTPSWTHGAPQHSARATPVGQTPACSSWQCASVAPGSTAGSGATRPRPLASGWPPGTAVVVPAALSLPWLSHDHSACQGLTKAAGGIGGERPRASSRGQGVRPQRGAWPGTRLSLSRLPKNREKGSSRAAEASGVPNPFLAESSEAELPQSPPRPYHLDVKISAMSLNDSPHPGAYPGILQMATTGQTGHISHGDMTEDPAPRAPQFLRHPDPAGGRYLNCLPWECSLQVTACLSTVHSPHGDTGKEKCSASNGGDKGVEILRQVRASGQGPHTGRGKWAERESVHSQPGQWRPAQDRKLPGSSMPVAQQECCTHIVWPEPPDPGRPGRAPLGQVRLSGWSYKEGRRTIPASAGPHWPYGLSSAMWDCALS